MNAAKYLELVEVRGMLELEKYPDHMCDKYKEEHTMGVKINRGGQPCGGSMFDFLSDREGYDDITLAAMELVLEEGPDALMHQLSYSDVELIKEEYPTVYERAIELGILTEEE